MKKTGILDKNHKETKYGLSQARLMEKEKKSIIYNSLGKSHLFSGENIC